MSFYFNSNGFCKMKIRLTFLFNVFFLLFFLNSVNYASNNSINRNAFPDSSIAALLAPVVQETFTDLNVPGAIIGVWIGDKTPWIATMGVADLETKQPISIDDKVRIGSITKTFTGTILLQLVDEGKIRLDDKLSKYFPDFPNGNNITIEQLGNMTSGIYNYSDDSVLVADMLGNLQKGFTPQELITIAKNHPPYFEPGTSYHYSNTNTILLGLIIEQITGNPFGKEIQYRIFNPLEMKNTSFENDSNFPEPHAHGYFYFDSTSAEPTDVTGLNPSWGWSAGAIISTLGDLFKFAKPMATGQLINSNTQNKRLKWGKTMTSPHGEWANVPLRYAFAICDFGGAFGHNGGIPGFNSFMGYIPEKDATIIVLVNMQENKAGTGPADFIARKIVEKIKSK